ncbi:hypothetical protein A2975_02340 [Candidatus Woesebacteria bacterium RIFCSPLOWO2_01_FULL_44_14]|uniref:Glycosyltransferase 2-like domain-containing protein n=1 Tax=Candidatus Woesebacteria bacterium RIFCSPLOWO2_01_FULL_44_14 TaxID=1802525 RepID=A0A1F8BZ06_9BACT|nr:MAG: hypothetical protein A2975_02340 [Candidatus Woesebacteria bacterium RIFCSPLOWO2_01_FULL_44_14]
MKKPLVSVIMPADKDPFIQRTVDSLLKNARTEIEIIVVLDHYFPDPPLKSNPRVRVIVNPGQGTRAGVNAGLILARGKYIMRCDCHCAFGPGYDKIMTKNCQENWIVTPLHYDIDYVNWKKVDPPYVYHYIGSPVITPRHGTMLPIRNWPERETARKNPKYDIDDTMTIMGGCYLANRIYFLKRIGILNDHPNNYGDHVGEEHEISLKYWLGGGEAKIIKKTWFAHFAKRPHMAHVYLSKFDDKIGAPNQTWICKHWVNNEEPGMIHPFSWLIEKFWPVPTWPEDKSLWIFPEAKSQNQTIANLQYPLTQLCKLAIKYNSVKCPRLGHCYTPFYYEFFKTKRSKIKKVLEIGDPGYLGADLRMWRDFFPSARIFGANTNPESIFPKDRIATYYCDEMNEKDIKKLVSLIGHDIDLVIDNASNHFQHQTFLFQTLMPLLNQKVTYMVENCGRTRQMRDAFPKYNCQIPNLVLNKNPVRDGLIVFTHKNT